VGAPAGSRRQHAGEQAAAGSTLASRRRRAADWRMLHRRQWSTVRAKTIARRMRRSMPADAGAHAALLRPPRT
jgi:hypothetical protein